MKKLILAVVAVCALAFVSNIASASPRGFGGYGSSRGNGSWNRGYGDWNRGSGDWNRGNGRGGYGHSRSMNRFPQVHNHTAYCGHNAGRSGYGYGNNYRPGFNPRFGY